MTIDRGFTREKTIIVYYDYHRTDDLHKRDHMTRIEIL